ncbi:MAG: TonB-dependent receptor [Saprospiraceae bacterium]|nr:TonB-dependent receptor [Saprospiraceae bacterium]
MSAPLFRYGFLRLLLSLLVLVCLVGQSRADGLGDTLKLRIVDHSGLPLTGAVIHNASFSIQSVSDLKGLLKIPKSEDLDTLIVSMYGYKTQTLMPGKLSSSVLHEIELEPLMGVLDEVVVVGRIDLEKEKHSHVVQSISARDMATFQSRSTADALEQHSEVFVQRSQFGGGSPIIRGFEASRILLVVDGVRMNNLIYRSGHLQNAITIDPQALQQMEVIYGPGSLLYGSDALGGVVHFRTKDPQLRFDGKNKVGGAAMVRYASAASSIGANLSLNVGGKKVAYWGSLSFADHGDLMAGTKAHNDYPGYGQRLYYVDESAGDDRVVRNADPYLQVGTGYRQLDMVHKLKWQPSQKYSHILNVQLSNSSDVPRYDQLSLFEGAASDLRFARWDYGPQKRLMISSRQQFTLQGRMADRIAVVAAFQDIQESRISRRLGSSEELSQVEDVGVWSLTADFTKLLAGERTKIIYGLELSRNDLSSHAFERDIRSGTTSEALTRYPDRQAVMNSEGLYLNLRHDLGEKWFAEAGARYTHQNVLLRYHMSDLIEWPLDFQEGLSSAYDNLTWGSSLRYQVPAWSLRFLLGSAFRAPNVDDLAKIRVKGGTASVPNTDLKPEHAINGEITLSHHFGVEKASTAGITGFYTRIEDVMVQIPFALPNGQTSLLSQGESFATVANTNAERGKLYGISANLHWDLPGDFVMDISWNMVRGITFDEQDRESPMAHVPPTYGRSSLTYDGGQWSLTALVRFNGEKPLDEYSSNSADNIEYATADGTPDWITYNVYASFDVIAELQIQAAVENITDLHYRPFASGVSAPGRNFSVTARWAF